MRLTVLGSGTLVADPARVCASYHVEAGAVRLLLDCGPGAVHRLAGLGLGWAGLTHVALTHFHTDHTGDLPYLLFALRHGLAHPRTEPLRLLGPAGTVDRLHALAVAFGDFMLSPGCPVEVRELSDGEQVELAPSVRLSACKAFHTDESLAYRIESGGARFGYTGDTGPDPRLANWLAGVDTLLAECSLPEELGFDRHLTPAGLAALARAARPRRLLATHAYPQLDPEAVPGLVHEAGWPGEVLVARDGLTLEIEPGSAA